MEYKKIMNLLDITSNQPFKFTRTNWVEANVDSCGTCNHNNQIKLKLQC